MTHILVDLNEHVYQDLIMFNLKNLLQCSKIEINEFFERTITEKKNKNDEGFCNLEISFRNIKLRRNQTIIWKFQSYKILIFGTRKLKTRSNNEIRAKEKTLTIRIMKLNTEEYN